MKKRLFWADLIRVTAIYLVLVIHNSVFPQNLNQNNIFTYLVQTISRTSIPLFIMLSGSLILGKDEDYLPFFRKRILKVVVPWIAWTLLAMIWGIFFAGYKISSLSELKYYFELTLFTNLWFLPLIAGIYILTPLWRGFIKRSTKKDRIYLTTIMLIFSSILPFFHNGPTFPLDQGGIFTKAFQYSSYFLLGYVLVKDRLILKKRFAYSLFVIGIAITLFESLYITPIEQVYSYLAPNIVICSVALFVILMTTFEKKKVSVITRIFFERLSVASLGIYILHQPVMYLMEPYLITLRKSLSNVNEGISGLIMGLIYFMITFLLVYIFQKTPLRKILP